MRHPVQRSYVLQIREDQRLRREPVHVRRVDRVGEGRQGLFPYPLRLSGPRHSIRREWELHEDESPASCGNL